MLILCCYCDIIVLLFRDYFVIILLLLCYHCVTILLLLCNYGVTIMLRLFLVIGVLLSDYYASIARL